jgi:D,D-heptose 1,7-bisphosphate phosphatase
MGTPDRLEKVRADFESGRIGRHNLQHRQRAIFLDRDGVLNVERNFISKPEELELYAYTPAAIRKINQSDFLSVVVTNQSAVARNLCTEEDVQNVHKKMETLLGDQQAWIDAVYYCPHHPDRGYPEENPVYKIDCECRKPRTGMFLKAVGDLNIDLKESWMIGDSNVTSWPVSMPDVQPLACEPATGSGKPQCCRILLSPICTKRVLS